MPTLRSRAAVRVRKASPGCSGARPDVTCTMGAVMDSRIGRSMTSASARLPSLVLRTRLYSVRQDKVFGVELDTTDRSKAEANLKAMCEKLLANTVIEDYSFAID